MYLIVLLLLCLNKLRAENFCINCKFFKRPLLSHNVFAKCTVFPLQISKDNETDYLVTGKKNIDYRFCSTARLEEAMCGPTGKYYQKKEDSFITFICNSK